MYRSAVRRGTAGERKMYREIGERTRVVVGVDGGGVWGGEASVICMYAKQALDVLSLECKHHKAALSLSKSNPCPTSRRRPSGRFVLLCVKSER